MFALEYHEATKHHFNRFSRSAGYLDWGSQPDPFRRFPDAPQQALPRDAVLSEVPYASLYQALPRPAPVEDRSVGDFLRCALGLSAWKQYQSSRWALRVNPSSGNLHPTEGYIVWKGRICHYRPREHALEQRGVMAPGSWTLRDDVLLVGLSSIFWREAWKYGERAFRYCQHDVGHAMAAVRLSASRLGWRLALVRCADDEVAALLGLDRDDDFADAEREVPECLAVVYPDDMSAPDIDGGALAGLARRAAWTGHANRLSSRHVAWPVIEQVAAATDGDGRRPLGTPVPGTAPVLRTSQPPGGAEGPASAGASQANARALILQRRSAVAFDARSFLPLADFLRMFDRLRPVACPWDAIDWDAQVDLAVFVHRVEGLVPGLYAYVRSGYGTAWRAAMRPDFLWEPLGGTVRPDGTGLFLLLPIDMGWPATRVSCDQDIAGDGFFSLGMIARFEPALRDFGESFYRRLFWECGVIGQVLYLEAEAAGAGATGIGCFYDDAVHELLGLSGRDWQSLYHLAMGMPVADERIASACGYEWETGSTN